MLHIEKWIQNGLDNIQDLLLENEKEWNQYFDASSELSEKTRSIAYLKADDEQRANVSFESLSTNFEAGLLLRRDKDEWVLINQFCYGEKERVADYRMILPNCSANQVMRVHPKAFSEIQKLQLPYFSKEANALLFKPCEDYAFILFSEFPKVILHYLTDEVHEYLLKAFTS